MARTPSTMRLEPGSTAPNFKLPDTTQQGRTTTLDDVAGKRGTLVMFICNHCPFVKHIQDQLAQLGRDAHELGLGVVAINSNDVQNYPDDAPARMTEFAAAAGYTFPYLFDESQQTAKDYAAACTPDFYLFDDQRRLYYRGQLDDARPGNGVPVTGTDLRNAIHSMLAGSPPPEMQLPSLGCNIKWIKGNEPEYAA